MDKQTLRGKRILLISIGTLLLFRVLSFTLFPRSSTLNNLLYDYFIFNDRNDIVIIPYKLNDINKFLCLPIIKCI
jgi:hypothetical protein